MLRLYDARSGHVSDVLPARPGRLVLQITPGADLRGLVVADLIRRLSERDRLRVFCFSDRALAELNVRPGLSGEPATADLCVGDGSRQDAPRQLELAPTITHPTPAEVGARGLDP